MPYQTPFLIYKWKSKPSDYQSPVPSPSHSLVIRPLSETLVFLGTDLVPSDVTVLDCNKRYRRQMTPYNRLSKRRSHDPLPPGVTTNHP